jgi:hypothetical protein
MNKSIAKELNSVANDMPIVYDVKTEVRMMTGKDLRLTPLEWMVMDDNELYPVEVPMFVAVEHKQQIKDAYKRGGMDGAKRYIDSVFAKIVN